MKKLTLLAVCFMLMFAGSAFAGRKIVGMSFTMSNHAYIQITNELAPAMMINMGTVHDPDCLNPKHIDNQFKIYQKQQAPKQKQLPNGHPPIIPQLKRQLKNPKVMT